MKRKLASDIFVIRGRIFFMPLVGVLLCRQWCLVTREKLDNEAAGQTLPSNLSTDETVE